MKLSLLVITCFALVCSCNQSSNKKNEAAKQPAEKPSFFPVTSYLKGQLYDLRNRGINPLKYTIVNGHTDSAWLKMEELDAAVHEFLEPVIDSTNMLSLFNETKFLDQTIDAFTFSYDPKEPLPDSMKLQRWDVYVNPTTSQVKRIYMIKTIDNKTLQLTWTSNKWCMINSFTNNPDGTNTLIKEEKITWDF